MGGTWGAAPSCSRPPRPGDTKAVLCEENEPRSGAASMPAGRSRDPAAVPTLSGPLSRVPRSPAQPGCVGDRARLPRRFQNASCSSNSLWGWEALPKMYNLGAGGKALMSFAGLEGLVSDLFF